MKIGMLAAVALMGTVVLANWSLERWGVLDLPFGLVAPAGVFWAGLAFGLRDVVRERLGPWWMVPCIVGGAALSWWVGDGFTIPGGYVTLALASGIAFLVSETADALVYEPLRQAGRGWALTGSNLVGSLLDSMLFLALAFGSLQYLTGQVVVKWLMILPCLLGLSLWRERDLLLRRTYAGAGMEG